MPITLPPAIIFDLDDTIISDDAAAEQCWRQVCRTYAHRIGPGSANDLLSAIRDIRRWYWADPDRSRRAGQDLKRARREIISLAFYRQGIADDVLKAEMADAYMELKSDTVVLIPGALDTLGSLRDRGLKLGLITNGEAQGQRAKVEKAGLETYFESILIAGEFGVAKPDPQVFQRTLGRLLVSPDAAWMVGDNLYADIAGAQAAGIYGVWIDWRGNGLPPNSPATPDRVIQSIVELNPANPG